MAILTYMTLLARNAVSCAKAVMCQSSYVTAISKHTTSLAHFKIRVGGTEQNGELAI
ncbi:hypothetical protein KC19_9G182200 [Ceratodon purpureus]|uniref:Uncharacterized protein n=1 Tax=Ceratodon purpureus TaxID=3225 RepID=A0A8T0GT94_CERPU|nr:hypothetical protein KC19_9G182200 [Ceratodon purpureus]